jgi:outer membrane protein assembly factor BamB
VDNVKSKTLALNLFTSLLLLMVGCFGSVINGQSVDWSMTNHDPTHTGFSSSSAPANPVVVWTLPDPPITNVGDGHTVIGTAPAVVDGYLYITRSNIIYCLNASTGQQFWNNTCYDSTPAVYNGYVYCNAVGLIEALNASTGAIIWQTNIDDSASWSRSPTVSEGVVFMAGSSGLYALNASSGAQIWKLPTQGNFGITTVPARWGVYVYFSGSGVINTNGSPSVYSHGVYALNASTGQTIWCHDLGSITFSSPSVVDGVAFVGSSDSLYAYNATTGGKMWNYPVADVVMGSPAVGYGAVYFGCADGNVYGLNATTGMRLWNYTTSNAISSDAAVADGAVYVCNQDRYLYAVNASTGTLLWKYLTIVSNDTYATYNNEVASPVIAEGHIYIGTTEGNLLAFGDNQTVPTPTPSPSSSLLPSSPSPLFPSPSSTLPSPLPYVSPSPLSSQSSPSPSLTESPSSSSIPEFSAWTILPLTLATIFAIAYTALSLKTKRKNQVPDVI